ncbi:hypothetical protein [Luteolibacter sp. Populi]|uniref:hypothetical protein n=1 Tax=Luteolibacter sp. Populi TaxID=3230487 RepID=UPI003467DEFC
MAWEFVGENSFEGKVVEEARQEKQQDSGFNKGVQEILGRHLTRQQIRAQELNAAPSPEIPYGFEQGTGQSVQLEKPMPQRNKAPGGLVPLSVPGAVMLRGYVDESGKPTPAGRQFYKLRGEGLFDDDGLLTEKGKAYVMPLGDALLPQNLDAFTVRERDGLEMEEKKPWPEFFKELGGELGGAVMTLGTLGKGMTGLPMAFVTGKMDKEDAEAIFAGLNFGEGAIESYGSLGSGGYSAARKLGNFLTGDDAGYYQARQDHERFKSELDTVNFGNYLGLLDDSNQITEATNKIEQVTRAQLGDKAPEIERHAELSGAIFGDPANYASLGTGLLVGGGTKTANAFRIAGNVERALAARATAAAFEAETQLAKGALSRTARAGEVAAQRAEDLNGIGQLERAARLEETATRLALVGESKAAALPLLEEKAKAAFMLAEKLGKQAGAGETILGVIQSAREARKIPFEVIGKTMENVGGRVMQLNDEVAKFVERHGFDEKALAMIGSIGGGIVGGVPGASLGAMAGFAPKIRLAGPMLKQWGTFTRTLGREIVKERGSVPFWQRVANASELSPIARATAHLADMATLGGRAGVPVRALKRGVQGSIAAVPVNAAFEFIADGGEITPAGFQRIIGNSIVFGGGGATLGGLVQGTVLAKRAKSAGNELNFRQNLAPDQSALFATMPTPARRVMSETAAAFPSLKWKLSDAADSFYDARTNTVQVGRDPGRLLEAVVAHEVNHHVAYKGQMEAGITAALVGTEGTGGIFRSADGTLDPHFREFMESYNKSAEAQGTRPINIEEAAVEYFVDSATKDLLDMTNGGQLQRYAGRSQAARMAHELVRTVIARAPLLSDLFYKIGGATDKGGQIVQGTGIMQDGIRTLPGAKAMLRNYLRDRAGRTGDPKVSMKEDAAPVNIELAHASKPLLDQMASVFQTDAAGKVIYGADGLPVFITRDTDKARSQAGFALTESIGKSIAAGENTAKGQVRPTDEGKWEGRYFPDKAIKDLADSGVLNARQIANLRMTNAAAKRGKGERFWLVYQPGTIKRPGKSARYGSLSPTFRDVVPVAHSVSGQGNILVHLFSVTALDKNVTKRAASSAGKNLYGGDTNAIKTDAQAMMDAHASRGESRTYFNEKYGPLDAEAHLNFINSLFGTDTKAQRNINPLFDADKITAKDGVYRSYRLDRINQATRLQGVPMPFDYEAMRDRRLPASFHLNLAPNGLPDFAPASPRPAPLIREAEFSQ